MGDATEDRAKAAELPEGDVIRILLEQHARIRELFKDVMSAEGEHKQQAFDELRALLAVHETAEEEIVYPLVRKTLPDGDGLADARIAEENAAKQALSDLEKMGVDDAAFPSKFASFRQDVLRHAENEERLVFGPLRERLDADRLEKVAKALTAAEAVAPTHPHPHGPSSATGHFVVGPFAAIADRVRDALTSSGSHSS